MILKKYDGVKDEITYACNCGLVNTFDCSSYESTFLEEFNEYKNLKMECQCGMIHILNMNIPVDEMSEYELEMDIMPYDEINQRKYVRDIMWSKRTDLKLLNRKINI